MNSKHLKKIINKQFKIAKLSLTYDDVKDGQIKDWVKKNTYTQEQHEKWKNWTNKYLREKARLTKDKAFIETAFVDISFGLKIKKEKRNNDKPRKSKKSV